MSYGGPIARSNVARGGRSWPDHGDGVWRRSNGELLCGVVAYRALSAALVDAAGFQGGGGATAVMLEWPGASCARLWRRRSYESSAAAAARKKGHGEAKLERGWVRAGAGVMKAHPGASWPGWAEQRRRAAIFPSTRRPRPDGGWPLNQPVQSRDGGLTAVFLVQITAKPRLQTANFLNIICRPMHHLQILFSNRVLILNQHRVKSTQIWLHTHCQHT